ncbi:MAG: type I-U CRISPR-associated protein Csb2, partial [Planctomycetota bacterium]|nr:type I-U CRISPR-associated protein Csb2 [Planctomycetota bacterium]
MTDFLCISVTFLQPTCHARLGQEDGAGNEWPPSPLRLFQVLVAGAAARWSGQDDSTRAELKAPAPLAALQWLERLTATSPPTIFAPHATIGAAVPTYVPNNSADLVGKAWARGDSLATFDDRTRKVIRPTRLHGSTTLHYAWQLQSNDRTGASTHIDVITGAARCIVALGWGVDAAIGDARVITSEQCDALGQGELKCWRPQRGAVRGVALRTPLAGTLDDLLNRHASFLSRLDGGILAPPVPLRQFGVVGYAPSALSASRPFAAFAFKCASDPERVRS